MKKQSSLLFFLLLPALLFAQLRGAYTHSYAGLDVKTIVFLKKHRFYYFYSPDIGHGAVGMGKYHSFLGDLTLEFDDHKHAPKIIADTITKTEAKGDIHKYNIRQFSPMFIQLRRKLTQKGKFLVYKRQRMEK